MRLCYHIDMANKRMIPQLGISCEKLCDMVRQMMSDGQWAEAADYLGYAPDDGQALYLLSQVVGHLPSDHPDAGRRGDELTLLAAYHGYVPAFKPAGDLLWDGTGLYPADRAKAFGWYRKAYDAGCRAAAARLIECYRQGYGTPQDFTQVVALRKKQGEEEANGV